MAEIQDKLRILRGACGTAWRMWERLEEEWIARESMDPGQSAAIPDLSEVLARLQQLEIFLRAQLDDREEHPDLHSGRIS